MSSTAMLPRTTLCLPISANNAADLCLRAQAALAQSNLLELRLDSLPDPIAALPEIAAWIQTLPPRQQVTLLATCRPRRSGGNFKDDADAERNVLLQAAKAGCSIVDLSLESAESLGVPAVTRARASLREAGAKLLISYHDFSGTADLQEALRRLEAFAADIYKLVPTANSLTDSLDLLRVLQQPHRLTPLVAISMGEDGLLTRVLGPMRGSAFTFATATPGQATAPGQLTAEAMRQTYGVGRHTAETTIYAVAGDPIRSSLSPLMLNAAFQATGLDAVYVPLRTAEPDELMRAARELPLQGFSVTMPLKQRLIPHLDAVNALAAQIGAVNTVRRLPGEHFEGHNTDVAGIVGPLSARVDLRGARVLVLGAGGAARAAVFGCLGQGAHVLIANRTSVAAEVLAAEAGAEAVSLDALKALDVDVLIQATPAGMQGNSVPYPLREEQLRASVVFDLVYNPRRTPLLQMAEAMGKTTIPGVEMFVHQGAEQFRLWTGTAAPTSLMTEVVLAALQVRESAGT